MPAEPDDRSLPTLISDLVQQLTTLVQTEGKLLRSELRESGNKISSGAIELALGATLLIAGLVILLQAVVHFLVQAGMDIAWASLAVGIIVGVIGYIVLQRGSKNLSPDALTPQRSAEQLRKDATLVREQSR